MSSSFSLKELTHHPPRHQTKPRSFHSPGMLASRTEPGSITLPEFRSHGMFVLCAWQNRLPRNRSDTIIAVHTNSFEGITSLFDLDFVSTCVHAHAYTHTVGVDNDVDEGGSDGDAAK